MKRSTVEIAVGLFVLIGIVCAGYLTIRLGQMAWFDEDHYIVYAKFESVAGLKAGNQVEMAGVRIGQVAEITLDPDDQVANVKLKIQTHVTLSDDVIASIKTAGLIGDKYIKIEPGGSDEILKSGGTILETESALDLEELISKYVFGKI